MKNQLCLLALVATSLLASLESFSQPAFTLPFWEEYQKANDFPQKKEAFRKLEKIYSRYHMDSALVICEDFRQFALTHNPDYVPFIDLRVAATYTRKLDFERASSILIPILEKAENEGNDSLKASTLLNLANLNKVQKNTVLALQRAGEATVLHEKLKNWYELAADYVAIGSIYAPSDTALIYYQKALDLSSKHHLEDVESAVSSNMGVYYHKKGEMDKAIEYYKKAAENHQVNAENRFNLCFYLLNVGHAYKKLENWNEAKIWYEKAMPVCVSSGNLEGVGSYWLGLSQVYKGLGDYKLGYEAQAKLMETESKLKEQQYSRATQELETKYETAKKETQLAAERQKRNNLLIGAIVVVLALGILFQFLRSKQKIRQKETELAAQIEHAEAEKLREMDALKSTFFANISHEFRTPLTLIVSPLEQMINGSFQGDFQKYYRVMHRNGKRLLDLVNQLLDLSRLESGKLKLQVAESDFAGFVRAVAYSFESLAVRKQIDYQVIVEDAPATCYFDKDKVEKILNNLISNAFKFTNDGKQIMVSSSIADGKAQFVVMDQGMGITADQMPHIFERFAKTVTSELQPGSGIGLALTKELVELHKGKIEVESREGEGTIFRVMLPISPTAYASEETTASMSELESLPIRSIEATAKMAQEFNIKSALEILDKPVLLVVEDNIDVRNYIVDQFRGQYQIIEAENGRHGLERALETTPDLVISDIMMPEMDGTEFCKLLKTNEKTSHIPVVMRPALAEQGDRLKGLELGADDYLVKPFDAKELTVRVANLIAVRQKLQEHYRRSLNSFAPIAQVEAESMDAVFLKKVREAVEVNLDDENFSVVELSAQVGMSRSQLHRKLSALTGFSPNEVIRNMRLERAKLLLEKKAGNASEVAYLTGFNSPAYFAKCFKDYFGVTPSEVG
ncbi:MAG: response regulator [Saprospiraceae bacterium]|nr:response regulator [Saprospiraceae bacterium]